MKAEIERQYTVEGHGVISLIYVGYGKRIVVKSTPKGHGIELAWFSIDSKEAKRTGIHIKEAERRFREYESDLLLEHSLRNRYVLESIGETGTALFQRPRR
tara:strand:- start:171 stop:473 length:303 start_codon:yes stop_codon:yes gene_type:complete